MCSAFSIGADEGECAHEGARYAHRPRGYMGVLGAHEGRLQSFEVGATRDDFGAARNTWGATRDDQGMTRDQ